MKLPNKVYDVLKWILLILTPAALALISGLGMVYEFDTETLIATISLVATFFGALIGVSTKTYYLNEDKVDENK